ncbi:hypothetical protein QTP86_033652, partial [Hemibagrus guttatus]
MGPSNEPITKQDLAPPSRANKLRLAGCSLHTLPIPKAPQVAVEVNGNLVTALLDSGSTVTLAWPAILPWLAKPITREGNFGKEQKEEWLKHCCGQVHQIDEKHRTNPTHTRLLFVSQKRPVVLPHREKRGTLGPSGGTPVSHSAPPAPGLLTPTGGRNLAWHGNGNKSLLSKDSMNVFGLQPKSAPGHEYILVIKNYATRCPEAISLRKATSQNIARELLTLFSRVGIPKDILTDQDEEERKWELLLPYIHFAIHKTLQASTGFTPFELLFGQRPRGLLEVGQEAWEKPSSLFRSVTDFIQDSCSHCKGAYGVRPIRAAARLQLPRTATRIQPEQSSVAPSHQCSVQIPDKVAGPMHSPREGGSSELLPAKN